MKKSCRLFAVGALLALVAVSQAAKREDVDLYQWSIRGTVVNATAAQLNTLGPLADLVVTNVAQSTAAITATAVVTPQAPSTVTPTITVTLFTGTGYDATGAAITNAAGDVMAIVTNVTATCSALPDFITNATAAITVANGGVVVTNVAAQR